MEKAKITTSIRIDKKTYCELKEIAEEKRRKPTELIRIIIENYIKEYKI